MSSIDMDVRIDKRGAPSVVELSAVADPAGPSDLEAIAVELRGVYALRRKVEEEMSSALATRQVALSQADSIIAQAQSVAGSLTEEARAEAAKIIQQAQDEAERAQAQLARDSLRVDEELAGALAAVDSARLEAAREIARAQEEAKEIVEQAKHTARELCQQAVTEAADQNRLALDELEGAALGLRRLLASTSTSLDRVLAGVSDGRSKTIQSAVLPPAITRRAGSEEPTDSAPTDTDSGAAESIKTPSSSAQATSEPQRGWRRHQR